MRKKRKKQVNAPVGSDTFERRMERQRARRAGEKKNVKAARNLIDSRQNKRGRWGCRRKYG